MAAPPKTICSAYAEVYKVWAQLLETIADIRRAVLRVLSLKNKILYGIGAVGDLIASEVISMASTMATSIAQQVVAQASAAASAAIEMVLAPLLTILMSGPEAMFALIKLPLNRAIKAAERERYYLEQAKVNLNTALTLITKWAYDIGGGRYAAKMYDSLPYIVSAIESCEALIRKLEVDENSFLTAQFDENKYRNLRDNLASAIQITNSDPVFLNQAKLNENIELTAEKESREQISRVNAQYKIDKKKLTEEYLSGSMQEIDTSLYSTKLKALDSKKKRDIATIRTRAKAQAVTNSSTYSGIINSKSDQFTLDWQHVGAALYDFQSNLTNAFIQYKKCQGYCYSLHSSQELINVLIEKIIELIGKAGNGAGSAVLAPLRFSLASMERVRDMFEEALLKYSSSTDFVSSTYMSTKLGAGNGLLISADASLAATITQSLIDLINADEELNQASKKLDLFIGRLEQIPDWDGTTNVWAVNPTEAAASPYPRMLASVAGLISTIATTGLLANQNAVVATNNRLKETTKTFRELYRHNSDVVSVLTSYTPPTSPYIEEFERAMSQYPDLMNLFLVGPAAFDALKLVVGLAAKNGQDVLDGLQLESCQVAYPDLFEGSVIKAQAAAESMRKPIQFSTRANQFMEEKELNRVEAVKTIHSYRINIDDTDLKGTVAQN